MCEDAAFEEFTKRLADIGLGGAVISLTVELACAGELQPGLKMFGDGLYSLIGTIVRRRTKS